MFFAGRAPPHPPSLIFKLPRPRSAGDKSDLLFLNIGRRQAFVLHTSFFKMLRTEHFLKWAFNRIRRRNFCGTPFFGGGVGGPSGPQLQTVAVTAIFQLMDSILCNLGRNFFHKHEMIGGRNSKSHLSLTDSEPVRLRLPLTISTPPHFLCEEIFGSMKHLY